MVIPSVSTVIHAYSPLHLYNQLIGRVTELKDKTLWISCTILDEVDDVADLYESFVSVLFNTLPNATVTRAIIHILDTATYIGWIYSTKYAVAVSQHHFSTIKDSLFLSDTDTLIVDVECIRTVPSYIRKLSPVYDCRRDIYPTSFIPNSQLSLLTELYIRLRGYNEDSISNILTDLLRKDLYQMSVLIAPFTVEQVHTLLNKWPISTIGVTDTITEEQLVELHDTVHVVVCIYDSEEPSGMLSEHIFNMYVPHNKDIM